MRIHATAVAKAGRAVLILGDSGSGKSDLAFRLLDRGWTLVGDDQIHLARTGSQLTAVCDPRLANRLEVRGLGLIDVPTPQDPVPVGLVVQLEDAPQRLPAYEERSFLDVNLPLLRLHAFEISSVLKLDVAWKDPTVIGRAKLQD